MSVYVCASIVIYMWVHLGALGACKQRALGELGATAAWYSILRSGMTVSRDALLLMYPLESFSKAWARPEKRWEQFGGLACTHQFPFLHFHTYIWSRVWTEGRK